MNKNDIMEINHESAMSLWKKRYGKATRAKDFAGREIDKGSYGNRNSEYGWNLDHILPQSQGGKDTESNLICCHIKTNDEKADKYPVFNANGKTFEIVKVENHYEIKEKNPKTEAEEEDKGVNFFDHSAGISFFKKSKNKDYFVGTINIKITGVKEPAILDFINEVFDRYQIHFEEVEELFTNYQTFKIHIDAENLVTKEMINGLLDDCVLLNTYFKKYFKRCGYLNNYDIVFSVYCLHDLCEIQNFEENRISFDVSSDTIHINELVKINTEASKLNLNCRLNYYIYDYYYTKLSENLEKANK